MKKKSQIFSKEIPVNLLYKLLDNVTELEKQEDKSGNNLEYYKINKIIFKKLEFHNLLTEFINNIKEYYYENKKFYLQREINYNNFLTIVRQICNLNNVFVAKKILYQRDTYTIEYYIYIKQNLKYYLKYNKIH